MSKDQKPAHVAHSRITRTGKHAVLPAPAQLGPRVKRLHQTHRAPTPDAGFSIIVLECSACPDMHVSHTYPSAMPDAFHAEWFAEHLHHFREHHADHPGREPPCGGKLIVTKDGKPFAVVAARPAGVTP